MHVQQNRKLSTGELPANTPGALQGFGFVEDDKLDTLDAFH